MVESRVALNAVEPEGTKPDRLDVRTFGRRVPSTPISSDLQARYGCPQPSGGPGVEVGGAREKLFVTSRWAVWLARKAYPNCS